MIVLDADIVSYFSRLGRLRLLLDLFVVPVAVSPNVQHELEQGLQAGYQGLEAALALIQSGAIKTLAMTDAAYAWLRRLGLPPDKGEADSLAYCLAHDAIFVTNDKRAHRRGSHLGARCMSLSSLLRLAWKRGILDPAEVRTLISEMETRLGIVVSDRDEILAPD